MCSIMFIIISLNPFKEIKKESGENVIDRITDVLRMAEDGLINNIVIVGTTTDGELVSAIANSNNPFLILGHKHRLIHSCIE